MSAEQHLYVLNPNSLEGVTRGIERAVAPLCFAGGPAVICKTLVQGPAGIQTQFDVDTVVTPLCHLVDKCLDESRQQGVDNVGFVIACFSDPGLYSVRERSSKPVLGIAESGVLTAMTLGHKFGVISILPASVPRHLRYFASMGVTQRLAADIAIGLGVEALTDVEQTFARLYEVGRELRDQHGADVLILGCAGMAEHKQRLQRDLNIPVVDPCQAAVSMAIGQLACQLDKA